MWRPVSEDTKLWFMALYGRSIDLQKVVDDSEYLHECLRDITKIPDIKVTKVRSLVEWRLNERVADKFSVGRVFIGGGMLRPVFVDLTRMLTVLSRCSTRTQSDRWARSQHWFARYDEPRLEARARRQGPCTAFTS